MSQVINNYKKLQIPLKQGLLIDSRKDGKLYYALKRILMDVKPITFAVQKVSNPLY